MQLRAELSATLPFLHNQKQVSSPNVSRQGFAKAKVPGGLLLSLLCDCRSLLWFLLCDLGQVSLTLDWGQFSACSRLLGVSMMMVVREAAFLRLRLISLGGTSLGLRVGVPGFRSAPEFLQRRGLGSVMWLQVGLEAVFT